MARILASDDTILGAPHARCSIGDPMHSIAPESCLAFGGTVPPQFSFDRHDYFWIAISLSACPESDVYGHSLDQVYYGSHTLTWPAMRDILAHALAAGFDVPNPTDIAAAVQAALIWSLANQAALKQLTSTDFELLPIDAGSNARAWWVSIPFSSWILDGALHPLVHALGYAGRFWNTAPRAANTRLHLSLLLTQEFLPVSHAMPEILFGDPAVQFYITTMLPPHMLFFPVSLARLHNAMTVRWGYFNGSADLAYVPTASFATRL